MDKIAREFASAVTEGCGKKMKHKGKLARSLRKAREARETSEYFKALAATAEETIQAFLSEE